MIQTTQFIPNFQFRENSLPSRENSYQILKIYGRQTIEIQNEISKIQNIIFYSQLSMVNHLLTKLNENDYLITKLTSKIDELDQIFTKANSELDSFDQDLTDPIRKDQKDSTELDSQNFNCAKKAGKLHYKDLFREKMFGTKQYKYKLVIQGKAPLVLFKERNINMRIALSDFNQNKISNQNAISIHLKAYYSTGQEIGETRKGQSFIKGSLNSTMSQGKATFDKLYPREVSRKLEKRKLVLVVYASGIGNTNASNLGFVDPAQIQPLIIYGIKVITKQNKQMRAKKGNSSEMQCESEFTL